MVRGMGILKKINSFKLKKEKKNGGVVLRFLNEVHFNFWMLNFWNPRVNYWIKVNRRLVTDLRAVIFSPLILFLRCWAPPICIDCIRKSRSPASLETRPFFQSSSLLALGLLFHHMNMESKWKYQNENTNSFCIRWHHQSLQRNPVAGKTS